MQTQSRTFSPRFEGRTRDAIVTAMAGNVVSIKIQKRGKRVALKSTAVLVSNGKAN